MSGRPAARLGDLGLDRKRKKTAPAIHGSENVLINARPAVRVGDAYAAPVGGQLASGSPTVFFNGRAAGRIGDNIAGATIDTTGSPNVFIGDSSPPGSRKPFREKCEDCATSTGDVTNQKEEKTTCELITAEKLKIVWPNGSDENWKAIAEELNYSINIGLIDSHERLAHFLGQCAIEAGSTLKLKEGLDYKDAQKLANVFPSRFSSTGKRGGAPNQKAHDIFKIEAGEKRDIAIATGAYENHKNLGNNEVGDGYKFIGRGIKQLTGRWNYWDFNRRHSSWWGEEKRTTEYGKEKTINFVENPELLEQPKYAVRSALYFWRSKKLWEIADGGMTEDFANSITEVINPGESPEKKTLRWDTVEKIYKHTAFKNICYNTEEALSNKKAKEPKAITDGTADKSQTGATKNSQSTQQ